MENGKSSNNNEYGWYFHDVRKVQREQFENIHNMGSSEDVLENMGLLDDESRNRYFGYEVISKEE